MDGIISARIISSVEDRDYCLAVLHPDLQITQTVRIPLVYYCKVAVVGDVVVFTKHTVLQDDPEVGTWIYLELDPNAHQLRAQAWCYVSDYDRVVNGEASPEPTRRAPAIQIYYGTYKGCQGGWTFATHDVWPHENITLPNSCFRAVVIQDGRVQFGEPTDLPGYFTMGIRLAFAYGDDQSIMGWCLADAWDAAWQQLGATWRSA